jgi:hypothetical protein
MITKDFHSAKDFRQIRGKSFVIMVGVTALAGLSGHTSRVITWRPAHSVLRGFPCSGAPSGAREGSW